MSDPIVIVSAARTPIGGLLGDFSGLQAWELGAVAIKAAVERAGVPGDSVDEVLLGLDAETVSKVKEQIDRVRAFVPVTVKDRVTWEELSIVALNSPVLPGVQPEMVLSRVYPFGPDFAHQVGYVGPVSDSDLENEAADNEPLLRLPDFEVGKTGVERIHERTLRGMPGTRRVEVNVSGRTMRELALDPATPGPDMQITLDHHLQNFMRVRLEGQSAAAIVMDVHTGEIVARLGVGGGNRIGEEDPFIFHSEHNLCYMCFIVKKEKKSYDKDDQSRGGDRLLQLMARDLGPFISQGA